MDALSLCTLTTMPPAEYFLRLQHGITGGFAPPTPDAVYTVTQAANQTALAVTAAVRPSGTPSLQDAGPKSLNADGGTTALVDELHKPPGSEDIYGMNTSIAWGSEDLEWYNGGPAGCGGGSSTVKATEEDKSKFKRAVEIVNQLVEKAG
ncbi:hypothetical protein B0H10DRAFT_2122656 [Mycena sp. CBHHK59/15]|nr:hypothetical protein B0H10DRAFT_2122656 [Mycena sp. CBHHK59/15]